MTAPPDLRDALIACLAERFNRLPGQCGGHADALIDGPLAGLIVENALLRDEVARVNNEFGSMTADWPEAWVRVADLKQLAGDRWRENQRLLIAFHDAIRRPLGVTPDSGAEFYDPRMADEAEERRRLKQARGRHAYQPHKLYPQCAQCGYPESEALMHLPADDADLKERGGGSAA